MKKKYHLEYEETEETFADMYEIFYNDRSYYFYKLIITIVGLLALFIQISIDHSRLSVMYITKFVLLWALAYVAGHYLVKNVLTKINAKKAVKTGADKYRARKEKCGDDLKIEMDFYEDKFTVTFHEKIEEYSYKEITRMRTNDKFYGLVVGGVYGNKAMVGFPASALGAIDKDAFCSYMEEKSTNVAGGFKKQ